MVTNFECKTYLQKYDWLAVPMHLMLRDQCHMTSLQSLIRILPRVCFAAPYYSGFEQSTTLVKFHPNENCLYLQLYVIRNECLPPEVFGKLPAILVHATRCVHINLPFRYLSISQNNILHIKYSTFVYQIKWFTIYVCHSGCLLGALLTQLQCLDGSLTVSLVHSWRPVSSLHAGRSLIRTLKVDK